MKLSISLLFIIGFISLYLAGQVFTGFVTSETCCTGENCSKENLCDFRYPETSVKESLNLILEIVLLTSIILYTILHINKKKK